MASSKRGRRRRAPGSIDPPVLKNGISSPYRRWCETSAGTSAPAERAAKKPHAVATTTAVVLAVQCFSGTSPVNKMPPSSVVVSGVAEYHQPPPSKHRR